MAIADPAVTVRDLAKDFEDAAVLDGIDLDVPEGEITLLMGPNGVGKTILLSCIAGGLYPDEGEVEVFGGPPEEAKSESNFMLQGGMLVEELTGRENVSFFRDLHPKATDSWRAILDELEFDTDALDREVTDYSGGMQRKVELAIELSADVPLYLLDEPTAGLDVTTIDTLHAMLTERAESGDTILMTSHLPADAELADRIAFVASDGIVADGTTEELLADVPPVLHVEGPRSGFEDSVIDGRFFEGDAGRRGFLRERVEPGDVEDSTGTGRNVRVTDPTYTDLFNYYVHVAGGRDE